MNLKKTLTIVLSSIGVPLLLLKFWFPDFYLLKIKPNLIKGLPSKISVAEEEFALRVQKSFPTNTSSSEIEKELSKQGFEIKSVRDQKFATFEMHNFACRLEYFIDWEVNERNEIYNLRGSYNPVCL